MSRILSLRLIHAMHALTVEINKLLYLCEKYKIKYPRMILNWGDIKFAFLMHTTCRYLNTFPRLRNNFIYLVQLNLQGAVQVTQLATFGGLHVLVHTFPTAS